MTHGDLFAGIGGFALAARWCGIKTIWAVEIDPYCQAVYRKHFPDVEIYGDVKEIVADALCFQMVNLQPRISGGNQRELGAQGCEAYQQENWPSAANQLGDGIPPVDLLTGGFPCQPFSVAGKRRGTTDDRYLWPEMLRIIRAVHPRWVIAENVPGIDDATHMVLDTVTSDLEGIGYAAVPIEIPACAVGAPHRRQRVWVVAYACGERRQQDSRGASGDEKADGREGRDVCKPDGNYVTSGDGQGCRAADVAYSADGVPQGIGTQCDERRLEETICGESGYPHDWATEPDVGRVAHGIPARVHRLRTLGNAIVPQVAEKIMRAMVEADQQTEYGGKQ